MTTDGYICAVSKSLPAGKFNDPAMMKEESVRKILEVIE